MPDHNEAIPLPNPEGAGVIHFGQLNRNQPQIPDPNNPAWGISGALLLWLVSIVLQIIVPALLLLPYALHHGLNPGSPAFGQELVTFATTDRGAVFVQVLSILPIHLLTFALLWAVVTRFGKRPFLASLGWTWSGSLRFWPCVGLGVALFAVAWLLALLLGAERPTKLEELINSSLAARFMIAALAVGTAPFVEEFTYRGVLYSALQRTIGIKGAVIFVLALFTLIHVPQYWPNLGVLAAVGLLSIALTVIRAYSGRLLPCVVIHLVFNLIQAVLLIIEPYAHPMLPNNPAPPAASMLMPLVGLIS